jgi:hypothetical protein
MALRGPESVPSYPGHLEPRYFGLDPVVDVDGQTMDYPTYRMNVSWGASFMLTAAGLGQVDRALEAQHDLGVMAQTYPTHHARYVAESFGAQ